MTENENSPENLRKFLESDDPALVRMGLSMAKGSGVPKELLPTILKFYMWDKDKTIRATAKSVFNKYASNEIQVKLKENWKASYRTLNIYGDKFEEVIHQFLKAFKSWDEFAEIVFEWQVLQEVLPFWYARKSPEIRKRATGSLIKALGDKDNSVRLSTIKALGKIGDKSAVEPLIKALADKDNRVRLRAIKALDKIGDKRAVEPLIKALGDEEYDLRRNAVYALGKIGDKRAVEPLIKALGDEEYDVRRKAVNALGEIGDKRAVEPLIKALGDMINVVNVRYDGSLNEDNLVCQDAVKALGNIGDKRAVEPLIKALGDECPCNLCKKRRVERAEINASAIDDFGRLSRRNIKSTNVRLGRVSHEIVTDALGKIGDKRAVEALIKALGDKDNRVRLSTIKALGNIGDKRAVEPLIKVLKDGGETRDIWINVDRQNAAEALGKIGDKRAVEPLIKALKDEDEMVNYCAEIALEELGHEVE